jgi:hypothetical protein
MHLRRSFVSLFVLCLASSCADGTTDDVGASSDTAPAVDTAFDASTDSTVVDSSADVADSSVADTNEAATDTLDAAVDSDAPAPWPMCDARPDTALTSTISDVWTANSTKPVYDWISGAYVTAISQGACVAGKACQVFLEEGTDYADLAAAAHHAIKVFVSAAGATHFTGVAVGDRVDVAGWGWRYTLSGQNEILLEVNDLLRGCMKKTGTGVVHPVAATLTQLGSVAAYETTYGPVLVQLSGVTGKTGASTTETFGLWTTGTTDAGAASIVSLSPFFLSGGAFSGLVPTTITDFATITGVFGLFYPAGGSDAGPATKYLEIYPRTAADIVKK